ncbi:MAG: DEAD/DEAH box helicase [Anaerolineaceae bacterium]|nr:DEAD/DEAH box helicase [Anaerolineaceae bacterium]
MDLAQFTARLKELDAIRDSDEIRNDVVGSIKPKSASEWPSELHPQVREALVQSGVSSPYEHQAEAIKESLAGNDVVLESPTASGKTLAFSAPMLHELLCNPNSHALMIYPMKALAFDQREQIRHLCEPLEIESWPYDGDTPEEHKSAMRLSPPHILMTNPEYLNMSFLGHCDKWLNFLQNLRFVVIDEMHEYRGFFGSNVALLLRRFLLQLNRLGANPRIFLSTATCANPAEHALNLTGRDMKVVSAQNVLRPKRQYLFVDPNIPDHRYWQILQLRVEQAALAALEENLQVLVFCPTKRFLEDAFRRCRSKAEELGFNPETVSAFHADLKNEIRQEIQQRIKLGEISVVFTTNALELGLDIGGLDGVILAGFPSNVMSAWQQIGRAGRSWNKDAFVLFYAMNDPIDRFFVNNIRASLDKPLDQLVVDPNNEELIENHLPSLVAETGGDLHSDEKKILGAIFYNATKKDGGKPIKNYRPQAYLDLRGSIGRSYELKRGNEELGRISEMRRFREAYIGAIFTFFGRKYRVHAHEEHAVQLIEAEPNLRTEAGFFTMLHQNQIFDGKTYGDFEVFHGTLNFQMNFTGYKLVDERSGEERDVVRSLDALYQNNLHAVWFAVPDCDASLAGIGALEHLVRVGAMFVIPADRFDTSTWSKTKDGLTAYFYENYRGGIGVARKLYEVWPEALAKGIEVANDCSCSSGCQNCIEPAKSWNLSGTSIDKKAGIAVARQLLQAECHGPDGTFKSGRMVPVSINVRDS